MATVTSRFVNLTERGRVGRSLCRASVESAGRGQAAGGRGTARNTAQQRARKGQVTSYICANTHAMQGPCSAFGTLRPRVQVPPSRPERRRSGRCSPGRRVGSTSAHAARVPWRRTVPGRVDGGRDRPESHRRSPNLDGDTSRIRRRREVPGRRLRFRTTVERWHCSRKRHSRRPWGNRCGQSRNPRRCHPTSAHTSTGYRRRTSAATSSVEATSDSPTGSRPANSTMSRSVQTTPMFMVWSWTA